MIVIETERSLKKEADGNPHRGAKAVELWRLVQSGLLATDHGFAARFAEGL
jgi:hypothetical protein